MARNVRSRSALSDASVMRARRGRRRSSRPSPTVTRMRSACAGATPQDLFDGGRLRLKPLGEERVRLGEHHGQPGHLHRRRRRAASASPRKRLSAAHVGDDVRPGLARARWMPAGPRLPRGAADVDGEARRRRVAQDASLRGRLRAGRRDGPRRPLGPAWRRRPAARGSPPPLQHLLQVHRPIQHRPAEQQRLHHQPGVGAPADPGPRSRPAAAASAARRPARAGPDSARARPRTRLGQTLRARRPAGAQERAEQPRRRRR